MNKVYFGGTPSEAGVVITVLTEYIFRLKLSIGALEDEIKLLKAGADDGEKAE